MKSESANVGARFFVLVMVICIILSMTMCSGGGSSSSKSSTQSSSVYTANSVGTSSSSAGTRSSNVGTKKTCIACNGAGQVKQWYTNDPDEEAHWEKCYLCDGKGYYYE